MKQVIGYIFSRKEKKVICTLSLCENEEELKHKATTYLTNLGLQNLNERSKQDVIKRDVGKSEQTTK